MMTRKESREASAEYLNSLSKDDLFNRFKITRVANITGYDYIGVPVYSCARPAGKCISVSAGKSFDPQMARAGAIAEAIEFHAFENPAGDFHVGPLESHLEFPTCKGSEWTTATTIAVEVVTHFATGKQVLFPSDLIWMISRVKTPKYFMRSSNGQAIGATFDDAFLQGLYEVVERDQVTLRRTAWQKLKVIPPRVTVPLDLELPNGISLYLFSCSLDIHLPTFWAAIAGEEGTFAGYGTHLNAEKAAERAILEAIQSRAVLLAGARDDILRRDFEANKGRTLKSVQSEVGHVPTGAFPHSCMPELSVEDELSIVLHKLSAWRDRIYFKHIILGDLHAVKVVILGMECPKFANETQWRPTRFFTLAQAYINASQDRSLENSGALQRLKEISLEMSSNSNPDKSA